MSGLFCVIMFRTRDCVPCVALQLFLLTLTVLRTPRQSRGIFFNVESSRVCRNVLNFRLFRYPLEYDAQAAPNPPNSIPKIRKKLRQHRIIPALRLKHRSGGCGTASALPKCSIMSGCGTRIVLRGQKPLALCDRCPCFGSLFPPLAALTFAASSIICAFGLASAAPRSPYRYLELCGIALKIQAACREFSPSVCTGARQVLYCLQNPCERK